MASNMTRRVLFAAVAIPSVFGIAWLGRWPLAVLLGIASALGARELYDLARKQGIEPLGRLGMAGAALTPVAVLVTMLYGGRAPQLIREGYLLLLFVIGVMIVALARRRPEQKPLTTVAVTILGALYPGWLLSFALVLRHPLGGMLANDWRTGMALLFFPLVLTWVGDSAAMTAGRQFGGKKMAPVVSPNKTWAGGIGGLFGSVALALIYAALVFPRTSLAGYVTVPAAIIMGVVISVVGQVGDVAESLFKREVGVKDSSSLLPGHGGVLDRLDSLYFVLPVTALMYKLFGLVP